MSKWGVRLISVYLFIWAISKFYKLISGIGQTNSFLGFNLGLAHNGKPIDVIGWAEVVILVYASFQLLRFHQSGRNWALGIFGLSILESGLGLIFIVAILINAFYTQTSFPFTINFPGVTWFGEVGGSIAYVVFFIGIIMLFYFVPAYFLMRKNVKQLFEKPVTTEETN